MRLWGADGSVSVRMVGSRGVGYGAHPQPLALRTRGSAHDMHPPGDAPQASTPQAAGAASA